ncbi:hypothetical protein Rcae01_04622 [Novipirellula caenicola]|uniref:Uncharacterized protein n=1 Tax=Novipirellula caenicola TaxID=1536901 RepID=A0ABP9VVH5_9BACT
MRQELSMFRSTWPENRCVRLRSQGGRQARFDIRVLVATRTLYPETAGIQFRFAVHILRQYLKEWKPPRVSFAMSNQTAPHAGSWP